MAVAPRTANGRATRQRILAAATELITDRGVAATSLEDVRRRAHASKSQLYLYFPDRDALLREVAERICDAVVDGQAELFADLGSVAGIERYLDALVALQDGLSTPSGCPIGTLVAQLADHDEPARVVLADGFARWEQALCDGLRALAAEGRLRGDVEPAALATQTLAVLEGGLLLTQVRRDAGQLRIAADAVRTLIRDALR